jgi:tRNA nucleotidyltransferase (CCA-adding enzyme)
MSVKLKHEGELCLTTRSRLEKEVLKKITPRQEERQRIDKTAQATLSLIQREADQSLPGLEIRIDGSVAKDTWLAGEADIDIFIKIPPDKPRSYLQNECLNIIKKALRGKKIW